MNVDSYDLGDGYETIADRADRDLLAGFSWTLIGRPSHFYAGAHRNKFFIYMHRLIIGAATWQHVDHLNGNGLDNRRLNLRIATRSQNGANKAKPNQRSRAARQSIYKGVSWDTTRGHWKAYIHYEGKTYWLGRFDDELTAAKAYDVAALERWGEFARLNCS